MRILSVNIGQQRTQPKGDGIETTGIYKTPADGPVHIGALEVQGDFIGDPEDHGGPDQAVYIYGAPDYAWWAEQLGHELAPGTFGENLTLSDFESARYNVGDRLQIGEVVLELTAPRIPCSTLARRMRDPHFVKTYTAAERPGMYCRVIREGDVRAGDEVQYIPYAGPTVSCLDIFREHNSRNKDMERVRRILGAPIAIRARADFERDLQKLTNARID